MIQLQHGDCLELMKSIPDKSIDMVLCDLPYGVLDLQWDNVIDGKQLFAEYKRICKQNANVLLFCQIAFAKYLMESTYASEFSHCLIWSKSNKTRMKSYKRLPPSQYEMILCFRINKYSNKYQHIELRNYFMEQLAECGLSVKELKLLIPNKSADHWFNYSSDYRIPTEQNYKRLQEITGCFQKPYSEIRQLFFREKNNLVTFNSGVLESDILHGKISEKRVHPTQKPVALLEQLLLAYSNEGDTILDNCMGSGSTGVACVNLNRNFIGMELEDKYFEIAKERIHKAQTETKQMTIEDLEAAE